VVRPLRKVSEDVPHTASVKKVKKPTPATRMGRRPIFSHLARATLGCKDLKREDGIIDNGISMSYI